MLKRTRDLLILASSLLLLVPAAALAAPPKTYTVTPLVSDQPGAAVYLDPAS